MKDLILSLLSFVLDVAVISGLIWFLLHFQRGAKKPTGLIVAIMVTIVATVIVAAIVEFLVIPFSLDKLQNTPAGPGALEFFAVGVIEETAKALPVGLLLWRQKFFRDYCDGVIYFAIAGQTFSLLEDLGYLLSFGGATGIERILIDPFYHAATCAFIGYFIARYKVTGRSPLAVMGAFAGAVAAHGFLDFFLTQSGWVPFIGIAMAFVSDGVVFFLFIRARRHDRELNLASSRANKFCHDCGSANPRRLLFCNRCGAMTG